MIDYINGSRPAHVMTIEDPIEYLHRDNLCIINQREIGIDTASFANALRSALRQDPDVILVGEMRDQETIEIALHAAETGHLVFSTLHTLDATETINRIISVFPPHQHKQIRLQLGDGAQGGDRPAPDAAAMPTGSTWPAVEVLVATPFIKDCMVDKDKTPHDPDRDRPSVSQYGMQTFDQFFGLCKRPVSLREGAAGRRQRWTSSRCASHGVSGRRRQARSNGRAPAPAEWPGADASEGVGRSGCRGAQGAKRCRVPGCRACRAGVPRVPRVSWVSGA